MLKTLTSCLLLFLFSFSAAAQPAVKLKKRDRKKDIEMVTTKGTLLVRLSDSTPIHRDNFLRLVKADFYDSIPFHRVINRFMIQAGDADLKRLPEKDSTFYYTIPAEFRSTLFHKRGVIAAAREGDLANPQKASNGTQFYLVQGRAYSQAGLDSIEKGRLKKVIPAAQRQTYTTFGGTPWLDAQYTVFGEVLKGLEVIDVIAGAKTERDRPVEDIYILRMRMVKRKS